jgi:hypothetical protein
MSLATGLLTTINVAVVLSAATVTVAGVVAAPVFEDDKATVKPPAGALPESATVPVASSLPPFADAGDTDTESREGGFTGRVAFAEELL